MRTLVALALALSIAACAPRTDVATLNLGQITVREDAYRQAVKRLVNQDDEICRVWLSEGTEPLTAYANKTTRGASKHDLQKAMAIFSQECFSLASTR